MSSKNPETNPLQQARKNVQTVLTKLNELIIGHEEINTMLVTTLVARENAVLIGKPGTAKTYTIDMLAKLLNVKVYKYLLTRFTTDIELFGTFNIPKLINEGIVERKWSKIVEADIIFLDEVFKANSAILNSLLSLLNERRLYDPYSGSEVQVNAWAVFGASNEVPYEEELQALYDRFVVRLFVDYLDDDTLVLRALESRWLNSNDISPVASIEDVKVLHDYAMKIVRSGVADKDKVIGKFVEIYHLNAFPLIKTLRSAGINISDRTVIEKLVKLVASYCAIFGVTVDNLANAVFTILPYLGRDKAESEEVKKKILGELEEVAQLYEKLTQARVSIKMKNLKDAKDKLMEIINYDLSKLANKPLAKKRIEPIIAEAKRMLQTIVQMEETLEKLAES